MKEIITLSNQGCDRATAYRMSNKILRRPDGLYVTWIDAQFRNILACVDPDTGASEELPPIAQGFDNHCGGALANTPDGNLHFMAGSHGQAFIHRYTKTPLDPSSWSLPRALGIGATYPSMVCDKQGTLHMVNRSSQFTGHWCVTITKRLPGEDWDWPYRLVEMPAPRYSFPGNSLTIGPDGTLHLLIEFYKTYSDDHVGSHSAAVTHLESPDGAATWFHDDGREVAIAPVTLEDSHPVKFKGGGNLRPGNIIVLPNNNPSFTIWDSHDGTAELAVRDSNRTWHFTDLTDHIRSMHPDLVPSDAPQIAVDKNGMLVIVCTIAADCRWGHPEGRLVILWVNPGNGAVTRSESIPQSGPGRPDWLASIEKNNVGTPDNDLFLLYMSGKVGDVCDVKLMQIT